VQPPAQYREPVRGQFLLEPAVAPPGEVLGREGVPQLLVADPASQLLLTVGGGPVAHRFVVVPGHCRRCLSGAAGAAVALFHSLIGRT
jgi:hypothetical protein